MPKVSIVILNYNAGNLLEKCISSVMQTNYKNFEIIAKSKELRSLEKIHETIHTNHSQKTYGRSLDNNLKDDTTWFFLNKQTAFVEKIVICDEAEESPLGPILVTLSSSNIDEIIDWIVFRN